MQPKFTLRELGYWSSRVFALALIFALSIQVSFSQVSQRQVQPVKAAPKTEAQIQAKMQLANKSSQTGLPKATVSTGKIVSNDAGVVMPAGQSIMQRTEAICTTYNGALAAGDPTLTTGRMFRDGIAWTCGPAKVCPGPFGAAGNWYDTYTWTNPSCYAQCLNINFTNTSANTFSQFVSAHLGSFNPANVCENYIADQGGSAAAGGSAPFSFTIPGNATVVFAVTGVTVGTGGSYTMTVDGGCSPLPPCTGTPAPGNTLSTANPVCPGINFTLSLQNNPAVCGLTWQWEESPNGTSWTPIAGANQATLIRNQAAATWYRCQVTCAGGGTAASNPLQVTLNPPSACYCTPPASDCTDNDIITRVRISTLDNSSGCSAGPPAGYGNFTSLPATTVYSGAANQMICDVPQVWPETVGAWIDYNQNGNFETSEFTFIGNNNASTLVTGNINIPTTALLGNTRMRVRVKFAANVLPTEPCSAYVFGETEDYTVNIQPCVPGSFTSQPANVSVQCSGNTTIAVGATGSLLSYSWQYRTSAAAPWQTVVASPVFSNVNSSTLTLTNVPSTMNGWQFRALMTGGCSAVDFSQPGTLTVTQLVATVSPASATICTGTIQPLSLTNAASPATVVFNASAGLPLAIPDANTTGVNNSLTVSGLPVGAVVTGMKVKFSIPAHTWAGDLCVVLRSTNGQILNLDYFISATGAGPTASGMVNTEISSSGTALLSSAGTPWTGTFRADAVTTGAPAPGPTGFLPTTANWSALWGANLNGNWTLAIYDAFAGDVGSLTAWSLEITYGAPAQGVWTQNPSTTNTMFTDALATVPYVAGTPVNTIYVNPTVNTVYTVVYSTATPCTSAPTNVPVNVVNPLGTVTNPTNRSACLGGGTTFTASATGGPVSYQWQVSTDGGVTWTNIAGATSSTLTLSNVTQVMNNNRYRAVLSAPPCAGTSTTTAGILTVNPLPVVTISAPDVSLAPGQTTTITGTSTPAAAAAGWVWTYNGGSLAGTGNTQNVNVDQMGTYRATVTDINGCVASSNDLVIGAEASDRLWIYPNPNSGAFQVRLYYDSDVAEKRVVTIYNMNGQAVTSREFSLVDNTPPYLQMDFDLGHNARGPYVVKVAHKYTGKVVSGIVVIQ